MSSTTSNDLITFAKWDGSNETHDVVHVRAPPLEELFLDEANAAREELLAEIQRSAETDVGAEPPENQQADDMTFGHKMMHPAEPDWNVTSEDFADEDLASLLRGDRKSKVDLGSSMHMLKLQLLTAKLGKTAWNDISCIHEPDKKALGVLHSQIMAQELWTLDSQQQVRLSFVSSLWIFFDLRVFIKK